MSDYELKCGDALAVLKTMESESVQCCVTSPPYWNLRDYGMDGQIGQETTLAEYVAGLVAVFAEVRRVLKSDGVCWVNLGDSRADKQLQGVPWRVAFALQADGYYLQQDVIWHKPNQIPDGATSRPTKAHEYMFLLSKNESYYYDHEAVKEPNVEPTGSGGWQSAIRQGDPNRYQGKYKSTKTEGASGSSNIAAGFRVNSGGRNRRSVWSVNTVQYPGAHSATFPPKLIEPCILAGSREGDTVLDCFNGSATTGSVALEHGRNYIGIELNPAYIDLSIKRLEAVQPRLSFEQVSP